MAEENLRRDKAEWQADDILVLKRNPLLNTSHLELLSDKPEKQLSQLRINEGVNLFVENKNERHPQGLSVESAGSQ